MRLKKQKILAGLLLSGTLLSVVMASQAKAVDTEVSVQFEDDTNVVHYAKDPDKREVDDANKPNADANGALRIVAAPNFTFDGGKTNVGKVDLKAKSLQEKNTAKYIAPFAKVADDRGGAIGWKLTAKLTDGKIKTIEGNELPGAELKVQLGRFLGKDIPVQSVPAIPANFNSDVTDNLTVLNGADVNIVSANAGAGQGETVVSFGERLEDEKETDRVQLAIADTNQILAGKKYTGKIVWTLNDTPA